MTVKIGHDLLGLSIFEATVHPDNIASQKCFGKTGFHRIGTIESTIGEEDLLETNKDLVKDTNDYYNDIIVYKKGFDQ